VSSNKTPLQLARARVSALEETVKANARQIRNLEKLLAEEIENRDRAVRALNAMRYHQHQQQKAKGTK
jgi:hypothetical protein